MSLDRFRGRVTKLEARAPAYGPIRIFFIHPGDEEDEKIKDASIAPSLEAFVVRFVAAHPAALGA